jgi:hypothetical protein
MGRTREEIRIETMFYRHRAPLEAALPAAWAWLLAEMAGGGGISSARDG